jgi:hypothetical protein
MPAAAFVTSQNRLASLEGTPEPAGLEVTVWCLRWSSNAWPFKGMKVAVNRCGSLQKYQSRKDKDHEQN